MIEEPGEAKAMEGRSRAFAKISKGLGAFPYSHVIAFPGLVSFCMIFITMEHHNNRESHRTRFNL